MAPKQSSNTARDKNSPQNKVQGTRYFSNFHEMIDSLMQLNVGRIEGKVKSKVSSDEEHESVRNWSNVYGARKAFKNATNNLKPREPRVKVRENPLKEDSNTNDEDYLVTFTTVASGTSDSEEMTTYDQIAEQEEYETPWQREADLNFLEKRKINLWTNTNRTQAERVLGYSRQIEDRRLSTITATEAVQILEEGKRSELKLEIFDNEKQEYEIKPGQVPADEAARVLSGRPKSFLHGDLMLYENSTEDLLLFDQYSGEGSEYGVIEFNMSLLSGDENGQLRGKFVGDQSTVRDTWK